MSSNLYLALGMSLNPSVPQCSFSKKINHGYPRSSGLEGQAESMRKWGLICQGLISYAPGNEVLRKEHRAWGYSSAQSLFWEAEEMALPVLTLPFSPL